MKRKRARVFFSLVKLRLLNHTVFRTFENGVRLEMLASVSSQCLFTTQYPLYYTIHGTLFTAHGARLATLARPFVRRRKTKARRFLKSVSHCYTVPLFTAHGALIATQYTRYYTLKRLHAPSSGNARQLILQPGSYIMYVCM